MFFQEDIKKIASRIVLGGNLCGAYACFTAYPFPYIAFKKKK